jgi:hypothetical protein
VSACFRRDYAAKTEDAVRELFRRAYENGTVDVNTRRKKGDPQKYAPLRNSGNFRTQCPHKPAHVYQFSRTVSDLYKAALKAVDMTYMYVGNFWLCKPFRGISFLVIGKARKKTETPSEINNSKDFLNSVFFQIN